MIHTNRSQACGDLCQDPPGIVGRAAEPAAPSLNAPPPRPGAAKDAAMTSRAPGRAGRNAVLAPGAADCLDPLTSTGAMPAVAELEVSVIPIGVDHLALAVSNRRELDAWHHHLTAEGVECSEIKDLSEPVRCAVFSFTDPDDFALDVIWLDTAGADASGSTNPVSRVPGSSPAGWPACPASAVSYNNIKTPGALPSPSRRDGGGSTTGTALINRKGG